MENVIHTKAYQYIENLDKADQLLGENKSKLAKERNRRDCHFLEDEGDVFVPTPPLSTTRP